MTRAIVATATALSVSFFKDVPGIGRGVPWRGLIIWNRDNCETIQLLQKVLQPAVGVGYFTKLHATEIKRQSLVGLMAAVPFNRREPTMTASAAARPLMVLRDLSKRYDSSAGSLMALDGINLEVQAGEFVAVVGKSGSGKSTLLNLAAGLDQPSSGEVWIDGAAIHRMGQSELARWRGRHLGIVFQFFQLLPTLTVAENVMLPMDFCATYPARQRRARALALLAQLDIAAQADKLPSALSGGQQQRAAIARALANDAPVLVADEPTGNLDSDTTRQIMQLFAGLVEQGKTVLMVTHERDFSDYFTRVVTLADGRICAPRDSVAGIDHSANRVRHA